MPISATGRARSCGFTLIELLVVLAILLALAAAFPLARERLSPGRQLQAYAQRLAADLRGLRTEAMAHNRITALVAGPAHSYRLQPDGESRRLPLRVTLLLDRARTDRPPQAPATLYFYPDGSSDGGTFVLQRQNRLVRVSVSALSGRVRVR